MNEPTVNLSRNRLAAGVLTSGEVAKMCGTSPRTVCAWIDKGALPGYRLPLTADRRVLVQDLVRFLRAHGMPVPAALSGWSLALWAGPRHAGCSRLRAEHAPDLWSLGVLLSARRPAAVVLDLSLGRAACLDVAARLAGERPPPLLACLALPDESAPAELRRAFAVVANEPPEMSAALDAWAESSGRPCL